MAYRPNTHKQHSGKKPSKLIMLIALSFACLLPYLLVKNFAHHKNEPMQQSIVLPPPIEFIPIDDVALEKKELSEVQEPQKPVEKPPEIKKIPDNVWQTIQPRSGDTMAAIFHRLGLTAKNLQEILQKNPNKKALTAIKPGQKLQFLISKNKLEKLIVPINYIQTLTIFRSGQQYKYRIDSKKTTTHNHYVTATIKGSLYRTAQQANIPSRLISKMTDILKKEIDFKHAIQAGDHFSIIYDAYYIEDKMVGTGDVVAVSYTNKGKTYQALRHKSANGHTDYYAPDGTSLKKAFTRYPIKFSHISSTFALSRYHPILHYKRAHKGIDLAAPIGTPIQATGDGVITTIDRHNGYGNMIKIKHDKTYSTIYGHMLKFQKGLYKGSRVKRGQVIGYVGQTGLASGPHCHYELHVNNQPRNPTTTGLPIAPSVPRREMASFKSKTRTLLAQLKLYEAAHLAASKNNKRRAG
jgi:murein DD-endopeptidase MepM/ murein hydrolase activator NlpD